MSNRKYPPHWPIKQGGLYIIQISPTHYYGGRSRSFRKRWIGHLDSLCKGTHGNSYMQHVYNQHKMFEPKVLSVLATEQDQHAAEQAWLDEHHGKPGCVNISAKSDGAMWGHKWSEDAIRQRRKTLGIIEMTLPDVMTALRRYYAEYDCWPTKRSDDASEYFGHTINWQSVDTALSLGHRGLPKGSSLAKLCKTLKPDLTLDMILAAATRFHEQDALALHRHWPQSYSARATKCFGFPERWLEVDNALKNGTRGLPGGQTLAGILKTIDGGIRKPDLTEALILEAAKKHYARTGRYPVTGVCQEAADVDFGFPETWAAVNMCLIRGERGLPGDSCLLDLLRRTGLKQGRQNAWVRRKAEQGQEYPLPAPPTPVDQTGYRRPETERIAAEAKLAQAKEAQRLLTEQQKQFAQSVKPVPKRVADNPKPDLSEATIREAAQKFHAKNGFMPTPVHGDASEYFGYHESWKAVSHAVRYGFRGMPGGTTLFQMLNGSNQLTEDLIIAAARRFHDRENRWPHCATGDASVDFGRKETWVNVDQSLAKGLRGLPGGSSLSKLLKAHKLK